MGAFDCTSVTMAPQGPEGDGPSGFPHCHSKDCIRPCAKSAQSASHLTPFMQSSDTTQLLMSRTDAENLIILPSMTNSAPDLPLLLVRDGLALSTAGGREKEARERRIFSEAV